MVEEIDLPGLTSATRMRETIPLRDPLLVLMCVLVSSAPLPAQERILDTDFPLRVTRVDTIDPSDGFGRLLDGAVDAEGNAYVLDHDNNQVIAIAPDGTIRFRHGRRGRGPGEYQLLYRMAVGPDGNLHIFDFSANSISEVTPSGDFVDRHRLGLRLNQVDGLLIDESGRPIVSGVVGFGDAARDASIHTFDADFAHVRSFGPLPAAEDSDVLRFWGAGGIEWAGADRILFTRRLPYEIYEFTPDGVQRRVIRAPFDYDLGPDDAIRIQEAGGRRTISRSDLEVPRIMTARVLGSTGLILAGRIEGEARFWDLFDREGSLIASTRVPASWKGVLGYDSARHRLWVRGERALEPVVFRIELERDESG